MCARTCFHISVLALLFIVLFPLCELLSRLCGTSSIFGNTRENITCHGYCNLQEQFQGGMIFDINLGITLIVLRID